MKHDRLSWQELHAYTNAKVVLRRVNGLLTKGCEESEREDLLRKTGEFAIDVMDAIRKVTDEKSYISLLERGNELVGEIIDIGLIQKGQNAPLPPDWELLRTITCIRALGMRLSEFKLVDLDDEGGQRLPDQFVKLNATNETYRMFREAAHEHPAEYDRRVSSGEFVSAYGHFLNFVAGAEKSVREKLALNRSAGRADLLDDAARKTACALMHINAGLCHESDKDKREAYTRCAKLVTSAETGAMYEALVSDDPFYSSRRLFEAEKEAFLAGKSSPPENISWELDSILGKLDAYERLATEACSFVEDIAARELIEGNGECEPDRHLTGCIGKIKSIGLEIHASAAILFHDQYGPSRRAYYAVDAAKSGRCLVTGDAATDKIVELLALCYACDATARLSDGKKTMSEARFDAIYGDMLQMTKRELRTASGSMEENVSQYVAENGGGRNA